MHTQTSIPRPVAVVIPVYGGAPLVQACLDAVVKHTPREVRLIVIDDASPDWETASMLERWTETTRVELVRQPKNRGFVGTVNHGFELAGQSDIVILNSDTRVTRGWIEGLVDCAYSNPAVATCSPLTNSGSIFAVPKIGASNPLPEGWTEDDVAVLVAQISERTRPQVPTGHGFCMYVKRAALDDVGVFDQEAFGRGYGEENDFCVRATERGWIHLIDDATFVYHEGGGTFGAEKQARLAAAREILDERYPYYRPQVHKWIALDPLAVTRQRVLAAYEAAPKIPAPSLTERVDRERRPRLLFVLHAGKGGVLHTTNDLIGHLLRDYDVWELKSNRTVLTLIRHLGNGHVETRRFSPRLTPQLMDITHNEYRAIFSAVLDEVSPDLVHVRHLLAHTHDPVRLAKARGLPVVFSVHDYYLVCPNFVLINNRGQYCGGWCNDDKEDCSLNKSWFEFRPRLKNAYLHQWRENVKTTLEQVDALITTADHPKKMVLEHYPTLANKPFHVIEHGRDLSAYEPLPEPAEGGPLRVITFGAIGPHKGLEVLEQVAARLANEPVQLHVLGNVSRPLEGPITQHGTYDRSVLPERLKEIDPHVVLLPSIMPETYCHTLTEAWAMGLPVVAADRAALQERVGRTGAGWLVDPSDPEAIANLLLRIHRNPEERAQARARALELRFPTASDMARAYDEVYRIFMPTAPLSRPAFGATSPARIAAEAEMRASQRASARKERPPTLRMAAKTILYQVPGVERVSPPVLRLMRRIFRTRIRRT